MSDDRDRVLEGVDASRRAGWARAYQAQGQLQRVAEQNVRMRTHAEAFAEALLESLAGLQEMTSEHTDRTTRMSSFPRIEDAEQALIAMWQLGFDRQMGRPPKPNEDFRCCLSGCEHTFTPATQIPVPPPGSITDSDTLRAAGETTEKAKNSRLAEVRAHVHQHLKQHSYDDIMIQLARNAYIAEQHRSHLLFLIDMIGRNSAALASFIENLRADSVRQGPPSTAAPKEPAGE